MVGGVCRINWSKDWGWSPDRRLLKLVRWNKNTCWETDGGNGRKIKVTETYTELAGKQQDLKDMRYVSFDGGKEK